MKALAVQNLTKTYRNGVHALNGVSLSIEQGDFFALLGPNGAGKTTLIGIVTSLVTKTSGKVEVLGYDIDHHFPQAKACIGVVPKEFNFNIFDKVENIILDQAGYYGIARKEARIRTEKYLKLLNLWEKRHSIPRFLSGGMKRRLMIARALVHEPKVLILDEPTAGVDVELRRSTWDFLRGINEQGTTIILTTHYLEEAESHCRTIGIIDKGKLIELTEMSKLLGKLAFENVILNLREPVSEAPSILDCRIKRIDPKTLEAEVPNAVGLTQFFAMLAAQGIEVQSMRNKVNRLEELFIRLTNEGKGSHDAA
jgi:ABC-2 type transport system ATP-binding protein